jgi:acyl-[acyl-carrier-protein]-phospholipid O-acyltransferase/long-chain-fatty-acid--[acyl-carrier-protein] ligase
MKTIHTSILRTALLVLLRGIGKLFFRMHITGHRHIPERGGALLVANHVSYLDFLIMLTAIRRPVYFVMNADVFRKPLLRPVLRWAGCVPVEARNGKNDLERFNVAVVRLVSEGHLVAIFAEGTVSRTGQLLEFRKGVEHLSRLIAGPVIPVHFGGVIGTPFTYTAGRVSMVKIRLSRLRKPIYVAIGAPVHGPVSAFQIRQKVKELEAVNFERELHTGPGLRQRITRVLQNNPQGSWDGMLSEMPFSSLPERLAMLNELLTRPLARHQKVAVLLPKDPESLLIYLWLLINRKCAVPIRPEWSNEERLYVMNQSGARMLITVNDLNFTQCAPVEDEVIYLEDMHEAMSQRKELHVICKNLHAAGRELRSWFYRSPERTDVVVEFYRKEENCWKHTSLDATNLLAVVQSLRQVHEFRRDARMYHNLPMCTAYGYVLELLIPLVCDLNLSIASDRTTDERFAHALLNNDYATVIATPGQLRAIADIALSKNIPFLTHLFCADIHPHDASVQLLQSRGITVYCCAGSDETTSVFAINKANYYGRDIVGKHLEQEALEHGSVGKPLPGISVKVTAGEDPDQELDRDETGILWFKGSAIAMTPHHSGWWKSPWKGRINHKGFVFLEAA